MPGKKESPQYVPVSEWPTLHDLCDGFGEHLLPLSSKLAGRQIKFVFDTGIAIEHDFKDGKTLTWTLLNGNEVGPAGDAAYKTIEVRPRIFFIDFYKASYEEQVSIVFDENSGQAVVAVSGLKNIDGTKRTSTSFTNAIVDGFGLIKPFQRTMDLIGKHIVYRYTKKDVYEHVYLNQGTFTWHCLKGTELGLADTEPCMMLELSEQLYLLFWTEKIMPVESVVVVDLKSLRSTGRFFCWDPTPGKIEQSLFGSYATILGDWNSKLEEILG